MKPTKVDNNEYAEFVKKLEAKFGSFILDARAGCINKSAALRARKFSSELREDLKNFRLVSLQVNRNRALNKNDEIIEAEDGDDSSTAEIIEE